MATKTIGRDRLVQLTVILLLQLVNPTSTEIDNLFS
jgi:hypothetical protein